MRITKRQLKRIIKEEMGEWDKGKPGYEVGKARGSAKKYLKSAADDLFVAMDHLEQVGDDGAHRRATEAYRKTRNIIAFLNTGNQERLSESQTAGPPISGDHAIALGGSYGGPPKNKMFDIEMEARDTAVNIFKGGGDREEVMMSLHELFPEVSDYLGVIVDEAEDMLEFGLR